MVVGLQGNDFLAGRDGADRVRGIHGNDFIMGDSDDWLAGGIGAEVIYG